MQLHGASPRAGASPANRDGGRAWLYRRIQGSRLSAMAWEPLQRRRALAALAALVLVWLVVWSQQRDPQAQARALFARLQDEVKQHDAAGIIGELDPRYDIAGL